MALTKQGDFTDDFTALADKPNKTSAQMKALFQSQPAELKVTLNNLIDALMAVLDGSSGADNIGMTAITETGTAATVQAIIEALITKLKAVANGASGADLIGMTAITETGANATVQSIIEALITAIKATADSGSGADLVGMTAIAEAGAGVTVQSVVEGLVTRLKAVTDSDSGADLIGATAITSLGVAATVQAILEALAPMTTEGDIIYQGASAPARLAKGTAGYFLKQGASVPEWADGSLGVNSGTFTDSTSIAQAATYTKSIPLGNANEKLVIAMIKSSSPGALIIGGTTTAQAIAEVRYNDAYGGNYMRAVNNSLCAFDDAAATSGSVDIYLIDVYIDGTNLKFTWQNVGSSGAKSLNVSVFWEVLK